MLLTYSENRTTSHPTTIAISTRKNHKYKKSKKAMEDKTGDMNDQPVKTYDGDCNN